MLGEAVNPDADIKIHFEDGYIIDKEAERARDLVEVQERLMQPWEYRVKWYGEDEETAKPCSRRRPPRQTRLAFWITSHEL